MYFRQCIFCNQPEKVILLTSNSMNSHYWRQCPMLVRCKHCNQVVEVATLTEHLLMECEKSELFTQCSQCTEAVNKDKLQKHATECNGIFFLYFFAQFFYYWILELPDGHVRCPLCHRNLEADEHCWKTHFMTVSNLCVKNTRVKSSNSKQVTIQV